MSVLVPYQMPWMTRSLTKSATAVGLLNVTLIMTWLVSCAAPWIAATFVSSIAATFLFGYLLSFAWGGIWWIKGTKAVAPA